MVYLHTSGRQSPIQVPTQQCTAGSRTRDLSIISLTPDIIFHPQKSQVITVGGGNPMNSIITSIITISDTPVLWANKVKYLVVSFHCKSGLTDLTNLFCNFYDQFNNISSVIGKGYNELMKLHLMKSYCLPSLFYGCEVWSISTSDVYKINVVWNNGFRQIFGGFWRESVKLQQFLIATAKPGPYTEHRSRITHRPLPSIGPHHASPERCLWTHR